MVFGKIAELNSRENDKMVFGLLVLSGYTAVKRKFFYDGKKSNKSIKFCFPHTLIRAKFKDRCYSQN